MKRLLVLVLVMTIAFGLFANGTKENAKDTESAASTIVVDKEAYKEELKAGFLQKANDVVINEDSVTFQDASGKEGKITIMKNPKRVANLYASFTTLWYEAGGVANAIIGGSSSQTLYEEYIGRDITKDEGIIVVSNSSAGKKWDTEKIIASNPDLIICSTAMSGYSTIKAPAEAIGIPVIAMRYNDFSDYLMWFKVFSALTGHEDLWESVALKALDDVVDVITSVPDENNPKVFSMFFGGTNLQANTSNTVVGGMINQLKGINITDMWENAASAERLDINLETVYAANPDLIVVQCHAGTDAAAEAVAKAYGDDVVWNSLSAVKNGKIIYLEKELFHNKPNSRFADAYKILAGYLYPDSTF